MRPRRGCQHPRGKYLQFSFLKQTKHRGSVLAVEIVKKPGWLTVVMAVDNHTWIDPETAEPPSATLSKTQATDYNLSAAIVLYFAKAEGGGGGAFGGGAG